jgi:hypothetical protein
MDRDEKIAMKAACIQAAAALVAGVAQPPQPARVFGRNEEAPSADTGNCARFARDLFGKLTGEPWE